MTYFKYAIPHRMLFVVLTSKITLKDLACIVIHSCVSGMRLCAVVVKVLRSSCSLTLLLWSDPTTVQPGRLPFPTQQKQKNSTTLPLPQSSPPPKPQSTTPTPPPPPPRSTAVFPKCSTLPAVGARGGNGGLSRAELLKQFAEAGALSPSLSLTIFLLPFTSLLLCLSSSLSLHPTLSFFPPFPLLPPTPTPSTVLSLSVSAFFSPSPSLPLNS